MKICIQVFKYHFIIKHNKFVVLFIFYIYIFINQFFLLITTISQLSIKWRNKYHLQDHYIGQLMLKFVLVEHYQTMFGPFFPTLLNDSVSSSHTCSEIVHQNHYVYKQHFMQLIIIAISTQ
jgi:hypothetical protein